ncbi:MAG: Ig-like domain-containing protein [Trueperaceae bacterium]|nr:Ig-like domain-containing protein [Trueperaceae bacterium]
MTVTGTRATIDAALDTLRYQPTADYHGNDTLTLSVSDLGDAGENADQDGATDDNVGDTANVATLDVALTVTPVNDRPNVDAAIAVTLTTDEDVTTSPVSFLDLLGARYDDAADDQTASGGDSTATPFSYVALVGNAATAVEGTWQVGAGASWTDVPTAGLGEGAALILSATTQLRFVPAADANGAMGALSIRLADGSAALTADPTITVDLTAAANGDADLATGAWSLDAVTVGADVTPVNDAPTTSDAAVTVLEDTATALASDDFGSYADVEGSPLAAIRIVTLPTAGTLERSDDGTTWITVAAAEEIDATELANGRLRFTAATNENGAEYATLTFRVSDGTDWSAAASALTIDVTQVSDAPSGADATIDVFEDQAHTFVASDFGFADPDDDPADAFAFVTIASLPASGSLTLNGVAAQANDRVAVADLVTLVFTPVPDANGDGYASFTVQVEDDGSTASGGQVIDAAPSTLTFDVTSVNDAPTALVSRVDAADVTEDAADPAGQTLADLFGAGVFSDAADDAGGSTADTLAGVAITANPVDVGVGRWQHSLDAGASWTSVPAGLSDASALTLTATAQLRFLPAADYEGATTDLTVRLIESGGVVYDGATGVNVASYGGTYRLRERHGHARRDRDHRRTIRPS